MPLSTAAINSGATGSFTGGTALNLNSKGIESGRNVLYVEEDQDLLSRREIDCSVSYPKPQASAPNGYTQSRSTLVIKSPLDLDNGDSTINTVRVVLATDPETTATEIQELLVLAAQCLLDSDFADFWKQKSVS